GPPVAPPRAPPVGGGPPGPGHDTRRRPTARTASDATRPATHTTPNARTTGARKPASAAARPPVDGVDDADSSSTDSGRSMSCMRDVGSHALVACHAGATSLNAGVAAAHANAAASTKCRTAADRGLSVALDASATTTISETLSAVFRRNSIIPVLLFLSFLLLLPVRSVLPSIASPDRRYDRAARPRASSFRRQAAPRPRPRRSH